MHTDVETDTLVGTQGAIVYVGDNSTAGSLSAKETTLNGGHMFLDPIWKNGGTIGDASKAALVFTSGVDGLLTVGRNSVLTLGTENTTWADSVFATSGLIWAKMTSPPPLPSRPRRTLPVTAVSR